MFIFALYKVISSYWVPNLTKAFIVLALNISKKWLSKNLLILLLFRTAFLLVVIYLLIHLNNCSGNGMCKLKYSWLSRTLSTSESSRYHSYPWGTKNHPTKRWKCCTLNELGSPSEVQVRDFHHHCKMPEDWVLLKECGGEKTTMPWCWQDLFLEVWW